jgi:hypothetical protein
MFIAFLYTKTVPNYFILNDDLLERLVTRLSIRLQQAKSN